MKNITSIMTRPAAAIKIIVTNILEAIDIPSLCEYLNSIKPGYDIEQVEIKFLFPRS
jgi:hypothetical protein